MAILVDQLGAFNGTGPNLVSGPVIPGDNTIVVVYVLLARALAAADDPTLSGGGLTWSTPAGANNAYTVGGGFVGVRQKVFVANTGVGAGSFQITATFPNAQNAWMMVERHTGADLVNPVVQAKFANGTGTAVDSGNFGASIGAGNGVSALVGWSSDTFTISPGSGYTLLTPASVIAAGGTVQAMWRPDPDPTPNADATQSGSSDWGITALEIKAVSQQGLMMQSRVM